MNLPRYGTSASAGDVTCACRGLALSIGALALTGCGWLWGGPSATLTLGATAISMPGTGGNHQVVVLRWNPVKEAIFYRITGTTVASPSLATSVAATTFTDDLGTSGATQSATYVVSAFSGSRGFLASDQVQVATVPQSVGNPAGLAVDGASASGTPLAIGDATPLLTWTPAASADFYYVDVRQAEKGGPDVDYPQNQVYGALTSTNRINVSQPSQLPAGLLGLGTSSNLAAYPIVTGQPLAYGFNYFVSITGFRAAADLSARVNAIDACSPLRAKVSYF